MRKVFCLLMSSLAACTLALSQASAPQNAGKLASQGVLADGTPVKLRVGAAINTSNLRVGDELELDVDEDVRVNDVAVIPTTSVARVVVTSQALDAAKTGKASISLRYVFLVDGEKVSLRPTHERKVSASNATVVSADSDITIANGAQITAYVNGNLPLDFPKLRLANQPTHDLKITTTPPNAEVSVDGKVMGATPFSERVTSGAHAVAIRMAGFQVWRETVRVTADPTSLQIALKKQDGLETVPPPATAPPSLGELARIARAKKAAENSPKASGEPLELIPEEPKGPAQPQGTPQTPALHPEQQPAAKSAANTNPASNATDSTPASQPAAEPAAQSSSTTPANSQPTSTSSGTSQPANPSQSTPVTNGNPAQSATAPANSTQPATAPTAPSNATNPPAAGSPSTVPATSGAAPSATAPGNSQPPSPSASSQNGPASSGSTSSGSTAGSSQVNDSAPQSKASQN